MKNENPNPFGYWRKCEDCKFIISLKGPTNLPIKITSCCFEGVMNIEGQCKKFKRKWWKVWVPR